jgi:hypothetical protein
MYENLCGNCVNGIELTLHINLTIFKIARLLNCQKNVNSIPPTQLPHKFLYIVVRFIHNYFESPNIYISISIASKQSDWFDSQFHNQLSHDICACRQINWNRNKTTTTFVGQIA